MFLGELKAAWSLDREEKEEYHLTITAEDLGPDVQLSGSADVRIQLQDVNDNPPVLTNIPPVLYVPDSITEGNCPIWSFHNSPYAWQGASYTNWTLKTKMLGPTLDSSST